MLRVICVVTGVLSAMTAATFLHAARVVAQGPPGATCATLLTADENNLTRAQVVAVARAVAVP